LVQYFLNKKDKNDDLNVLWSIKNVGTNSEFQYWVNIFTTLCNNLDSNNISLNILNTKENMAKSHTFNVRKSRKKWTKI